MRSASESIDGVAHHAERFKVSGSPVATLLAKAATVITSNPNRNIPNVTTTKVSGMSTRSNHVPKNAAPLSLSTVRMTTPTSAASQPRRKTRRRTTKIIATSSTVCRDVYSALTHRVTTNAVDPSGPTELPNGGGGGGVPPRYRTGPLAART